MNKIGVIITALIIISFSNISICQTSDTMPDKGRSIPVVADEWTDNCIPKWLFNENKSSSPVLGNSIMMENENMIQIAPGHFISNFERLRVFGHIGLYNLLDFQTENGAISWGTKDYGNLSFVYKGMTNNTILTLVGESGFVGIGTQHPTAQLEVTGTMKTTTLNANSIYSNVLTTTLINTEHIVAANTITENLKVGTIYTEGTVLMSDAEGNATWQLIPEQQGLWTKSETNNDIYRLDGNVGIGTSNTSGFKLAVNGNIQAE